MYIALHVHVPPPAARCAFEPCPALPLPQNPSRGWSATYRPVRRRHDRQGYALGTVRTACTSPVRSSSRDETVKSEAAASSHCQSYVCPSFVSRMNRVAAQARGWVRRDRTEKKTLLVHVEEHNFCPCLMLVAEARFRFSVVFTAITFWKQDSIFVSLWLFRSSSSAYVA